MADPMDASVDVWVDVFLEALAHPYCCKWELKESFLKIAFGIALRSEQ